MQALPFTTAKRRVHRKRRASSSSTPTPAALTLVAASYDSGGPRVDLQFDRAIGIASIHPSAITVDDGSDFAELLGGTAGATLVNPTTVRVPLTPIGDSGTSQVLLSATASSGIVASDDGVTWAGVSDVVLPFP